MGDQIPSADKLDKDEPRTIAIQAGAYTDGEMGDGWIEVGPDHPDYESWLAYYKATPKAAAEAEVILKELQR